MAQIADPSPSAAPSPKQLGRQLRDVRKQKGLSRSEVARSAGLTRRELAAYERGKVAVPESDLWCLAGSCGVDVGELLPNRDPLQISSELSSLTVGNSIRHLRATQERDGVLREYLSMIYELRNLPPGSRVPLREADLATLADALGGAPDMIEQRLMELIGASREEAARLRAMILPPLSLPAASGTTSPDDYAQHPQTFDPAAAAEQYFSTPRADDPFGKPPSDDTLAPAPHIDAFLGNAFDDPFTPTDPFAAADPFAEATDLFAPPSGEPLSTAPPEADPFAVLPAESGFDPEGADGPIANPFAHLPSGMEIDDPFGTPRTPLAEARPFVGEASLTMDPFGAAYEASDMPLNTADLVTPAASPIDVPVEMPVEMPVDDDPAEMASESDETSMDTTGDTTGDTIAADGYAAEFDDDGWTAVAASMVQAAESTVDSTDESTGESTSVLGEFSESTDEFGERSTSSANRRANRSSRPRRSTWSRHIRTRSASAPHRWATRQRPRTATTPTTTTTASRRSSRARSASPSRRSTTCSRRSAASRTTSRRATAGARFIPTRPPLRPRAPRTRRRRRSTSSTPSARRSA